MTEGVSPYAELVEAGEEGGCEVIGTRRSSRSAFPSFDVSGPRLSVNDDLRSLSHWGYAAFASSKLPYSRLPVRPK